MVGLPGWHPCVPNATRAQRAPAPPTFQRRGPARPAPPSRSRAAPPRDHFRFCCRGRCRAGVGPVSARASFRFCRFPAACAAGLPTRLAPARPAAASDPPPCRIRMASFGGPRDPSPLPPHSTHVHVVAAMRWQPLAATSARTFPSNADCCLAEVMMIMSP